MSNVQNRSKKLNTEANPAVTNFILIVFTFVIASLSSLYWLQTNPLVQGERYWLISRAAAIGAYVVMSAVVLLGTVLSHPRNKDTWRWTAHLLPWHQALVSAMFSLIGLHLFFTAVDSKSGISWGELLFPIGSKYHPFAMVLGAAGLYALILISVTTALRRKLRLWMFVHRLSWISWVFVFLHGLIGGTDTQLRPLYWWSGAILFIVFFWRHWITLRDDRAKAPQQTMDTIEKLSAAEIKDKETLAR